MHLRHGLSLRCRPSSTIGPPSSASTAIRIQMWAKYQESFLERVAWSVDDVKLRSILW